MALIDRNRALGYEAEAVVTRHDERDLAFYALATGAVADPTDDRQLRRAYEKHSAGFDPLASYFGVLALNALLSALRAGKRTPGLDYGLERVLHAEQSLEVLGPLPRAGAVTHRARIHEIYDQGRHGLVVTAVESFAPDGAPITRCEVTSLVRSAGGFGGPRAPERPSLVHAEATPDATIEQATQPNQALLFRLLGDDNPLHADPAAARTFGLRQPILHGMCTLGFAARHAMDALALGRPLRRLSVRFAEMVWPGETLVTEAFRVGDAVGFRTKVKERDRVVLSHGEAHFGAAT